MSNTVGVKLIKCFNFRTCRTELLKAHSDGCLFQETVPRLQNKQVALSLINQTIRTISVIFKEKKKLIILLEYGLRIK